MGDPITLIGLTAAKTGVGIVPTTGVGDPCNNELTGVVVATPMGNGHLIEDRFTGVAEKPNSEGVERMPLALRAAILSAECQDNKTHSLA